MAETKDLLSGAEAALAKAELMAALSDATRARLARQGAPCTVEPWLEAEDFRLAGHEREDLFRIGPLPRRSGD